MQTLPEPEAGPLKQHLLVCGECRDRLDADRIRGGDQKHVFAEHRMNTTVGTVKPIEAGLRSEAD
jgi:hypothetical protein